MLLISNDLTGSACSLIRPIYESFIRGVWFQHKASDKEVDKLIKKDIVNKPLDELVKEIETVPDCLRKENKPHILKNDQVG